MICGSVASARKASTYMAKRRALYAQQQPTTGLFREIRLALVMALALDLGPIALKARRHCIPVRHERTALLGGLAHNNKNMRNNTDAHTIADAPVRRYCKIHTTI